MISDDLSDDELVFHADLIESKGPDRFDFQDFPFVPYRTQRDFMNELFDSIDKGELSIFESPTGTGKSLCILYSSLCWLSAQKQRDCERVRDLRAKINCVEDDDGDDEENSWMNRARARLEQRDVYLNELEDIEDFVMAEKCVEARQKCYLGGSSGSGENDETTKEVRKIFIASRTHSQLSQLMRELSRIRRMFKETRVVVLASRQTYCVNDKVKGLGSNALINDACLRIVDQGKCEYKESAKIGELGDNMLFERFISKTEIVDRANRLKGCPYYASKYALPSAQLVLLPYNLLVSAEMRKAMGLSLKGIESCVSLGFLTKTDLQRSNNVVIIDEAHNLTKALSEMFSISLSSLSIERSLTAVSAYFQAYSTKFSAQTVSSLKQIIAIFKNLLGTLASTLKTSTNSVGEFLQSSGLSMMNTRPLFEFCESSRLHQKLRGLTNESANDFMLVFGFLQRLTSYKYE